MKLAIALLVFTIFSLNISFSQCKEWKISLDSVMIFSSPRFVDLNKDNVQDIVIGAGNESYQTSDGIVAIDGKNGNLLWKVAVPSQIYTSALLQDINQDGISDVFIGGRNATLYAIDGFSGKIIWQFWTKGVNDSRRAGIFNFFTTQWLEDQNSDGFSDLLVANGGDAVAPASQKNRPQGNLLILSGATGEVITKVGVPHDREIYYAPHLHSNYGNDSLSIVFGTGGEAIDGKLWEISLTELKNKNLSNARLIATDSIKGFIVNSAMVDLNEDGKLDIVNSRMSGIVAAYDGISHQTIWSKEFPGYEGYTAPTIGFFNGDRIPDVFVFMAHGIFPNYDHFIAHAIDGKSGEIIYTDTLLLSQFASALAIDLNKDGFDEAVYMRNYMDFESNEVSNQFEIVDFRSRSKTAYGEMRPGICYSSTPAIADIDNDNKLELVFAYSNSFTSKKEFAVIECLELEEMVKNISFPGYLGTFENGIFLKK